MANKLFELAVSIAARLDGQFKGAFAQAKKALSSYDQAQEALKNHKAQLDAVMAQTRSLQAAQSQFIKAKAALDGLKSQMGSTGAQSAEFKAQFEKAKAAVASAGAEVGRQRSSLQALKASAGMAGKTLAELRAQEDQLAAAAERAAKAQKLQAMQSRMKDMAMNGGVQAGIGAAQLMAVRNMAGMFSAPVREGMEFQTTMSKVAAVSNASASDLERLTAQARELGAATQFSAAEAGQGMTYLAMAGFKTEDMLKTMPGMLSLAAAAGADLGTTADISSNILSGFGLKADQMGRVGDILVNAFSNSNTSLESLGESMKYVAPVASAMGVSLSQTAAMVGKLGDAGIQASQAGTALRTILSKLGNKGLQKDLKEAFNVDVTDSAGNLRNVEDILRDLSKAWSGMTGAQRAANAQLAFGTEAYSAALVLMDQAGSGALQDLTAKVEDWGAADRTASRMNDNLRGDCLTLSSAISEVYLALYDQLEPSLRSAVQWLTSAVNAVGKWAKANPGLTKALIAAGAAIGGIVAAAGAFNLIFGGAVFVVAKVAGTVLTLISVFGKVASVVSMVSKGVMLLNAVMLANPIGLVVAAIAAAVAAGIWLYRNWDTVKKKARCLWAAIKGVFGKIWSFLTSGSENIKSMISSTFSNLASMAPSWLRPLINATGKAGGAMVANLGEMISFVRNVFSGNWAAAWENVKNIFSNLWDAVTSIGSAARDLISKAFAALSNAAPDWLKPVINSVGGAVNNILGALGGIIDFVKNVFTGQWSAAWESVKSVFANIFGAVASIAKVPINGIISAINLMIGAINSIKVDIPDWVPGMGGKTLGFNIPQIPALASGGIVTAPTTALIGEGAEPEAVMPLSKLGSLIGAPAPSSGASVTVNFAPTINVGGQGGDEYSGVRKALEEGSRSLRRELDAYFADRRRVSYG